MALLLTVNALKKMSGNQMTLISLAALGFLCGFDRRCRVHEIFVLGVFRTENQFLNQYSLAW